MSLNHVDFFDHEAAFVGMHAKDLTALPLILAGDDLDKIVFAYI
jgi:hypothetical protein